MVVAAKDQFCARIDGLSQQLHHAARQGLQRRRTAVHTLIARRGLAGWQARLAMRGRHAGDLTHHLKRAALARLAKQSREFRTLRQRLEAHDLRRRLAGIRGRLGAADGRLRAAGLRGRERADTRFRVLAGRLDNLSPLAVLARGYAVCWNDERTAIIRRASDVQPGDRVRVTLHEGELNCRVDES
jgi:exodeoxyribonuclease VII large subunit